MENPINVVVLIERADGTQEKFIDECFQTSLVYGDDCIAEEIAETLEGVLSDYRRKAAI